MPSGVAVVGRRARMAGVTKVTRHSKADANHLTAEGASLRRNPDGTATDVEVVASGVELHKR